MPAITPYSHRFRAATGAAGAPAGLLSGELAYNMNDKTWYAGFGDDGGGNATSVVIGFSTDGSLAKEVKTGGTALQVYRKNAANTGYEWATPSAGNVYTGLSGISIDAANNITADVSIARLADPIFTGAPTAPTPANSDNSKKLATTEYVNLRLSQLTGGATAAFDTLIEIQNIILNDEGLLATLTTTVGGKMTRSANLSDLSDLAVARINLGLASMATQSSSSVNISGGTITGVNLRGGTF